MTQQATIDFARAARDSGIQRAVARADEVSDSWSERAYGHFRTFVAQQKEPFQGEDFRAYCNGILDTPPSARAFGGIIMRAAKAGLIVKVGIAAVNNVRAHRCFASVWRKA